MTLPRSSLSRRAVIAGCGVLVAVLALLSLGVGPVALSPAAVAAALIGAGDPAAVLIVTEIRLPRTVLALGIGGFLGLSGAALQGLLRNPLADPSVFGAPQAAAFGAAAVMSAGLAGALSLALPVAAVAGAFASVGLLVGVAGPRAGLLVLVLSGLAIGALAGAGTALALALAPNPFATLEIAFWLMGSLADRSFAHVVLAMPFLAAGALVLALIAPALRPLALGEEVAQSLGVSVIRLRLGTALGVALGTGGAVAVAGTIGFVGLVAPHLVRPFAGPDPVRLLLPSALAGAALVTAADILTRLLPTAGEIGVGVVTALVGVPFFLAIVMSARRSLSEGAP